ncbi:hypothetical protein A8C75_17795 [Marinobacterium aestuarii]|uniref:Uncharacterized protein n=1 Tax=Marinobacterium aestuarii TaxID=1821621 RepID=A0A1A9F2Q2_9GAMM|nr:hypothetical protein [Marinobacterium aestuarii]ANG64141.1 hypothetical protein A8C75_17795 [Marinobacterium aestuarii]
MCGLCGTFGIEEHWTVDKTAVAPDPAYRRRERFRRIAQANRILSFSRLKLEDFQGASYVLCSATGKQEMVSDLGALWQLADTLSSVRLDPLDPALLRHVQQAASA